jgi:lipopolysaccharide assembly outer membrane protein LptD (OstA)
MKLLILSVAMGCQAFAFVFQAVCQEVAPDRPRLIHTEPPRLHFTMPIPEGEGYFELVASSALRVSAKTESILHLRGNVAVRTTICVRGVCDGGSMVLHADAVDYNETTGEIEAHGDVHIDPYRTFPDHSSLE